MAEPTVVHQLNEGTEGTPTWVTIVTAARWTGPDAAAGSLDDPFDAPIADGDDAFFDNVAFPNDGELWHDQTTDAQIDEAGRNGNQNVLRMSETGATDGTVDAPTFTAFDDATDAANRTNPTIWLLIGTAGSSNISQIRAVETTSAAGSAAGWQAQVHDVDPQTTGTGVAADGFALDGDQAGERVVTAAALAASGTKEFNLAACAPHDATPGLTSFVYATLYNWQ